MISTRASRCSSPELTGAAWCGSIAIVGVNARPCVSVLRRLGMYRFPCPGWTVDRLRRNGYGEWSPRFPARRDSGSAWKGVFLWMRLRGAGGAGDAERSISL